MSPHDCTSPRKSVRLEARQRRRRRLTIIAFAIATIGVLAVAALGFFGSHTETYSLCQLTGRGRIVTSWCGMIVSDREAPNEVSAWADANSLAGITPGQCGWESATTTTTRLLWPSSARIGEAFPYMIPYRLYHESLSSSGSSREAALRNYQKKVIAAFTAGENLVLVKEAFVNSATGE